MDCSTPRAFCESLPKIELHAHLNGSLSEKTFLELGSNQAEIQEYQRLKKTPQNERTLEDCFKIFQFAHNATTTPKAVYVATRNVIQEFHEDNVIYLELRTTPREEDGMTLEEYVEGVVKAIKDNENDIIVKLILSLNRQHSLEKCKRNLEVILKMKERFPDIIRGIDLSGNPLHGNFKELRDLFELVRSEHDISTTIHCGEIENNKEVGEILDFHPDRIGHAPFLHPYFGGCTENWEKLKVLRIPTEFCLTSNIISGTTESYEKHHITEWISNNLPFSLNTDDKGVFHTTLSKEFEHAMNHLKIPPKNLWQISWNSIDQSFALPEEKTKLKRILEQWKHKNTLI